MNILKTLSTRFNTALFSGAIWVVNKTINHVPEDKFVSVEEDKFVIDLNKTSDAVWIGFDEFDNLS